MYADTKQFNARTLKTCTVSNSTVRYVILQRWVVGVIDIIFEKRKEIYKSGRHDKRIKDRMSNGH